MKQGDKWNAHGYYENEEITKIVVDYMREHDSLMEGKRFHPLHLSEPRDNLDGAVAGILRKQGLGDGQRWFYKNTKLPFCWRLWHEHFPKAQWVVVKRDRAQLMDSLMRTPFMNAYSCLGDWERFLCAYDHAMDAIEENCDSFSFHVDALFSNDSREIESLLSYISKASVEVAYSLLDESIWNNEK